MNAAVNLFDKLAGKHDVAEESTRPIQSKTETMQAVVWKGKQRVAVETVPRPCLTHEADAIVRVTSCSICSGSDSHVFAGEIPNVKSGQILGHEAMGIVDQVGERVSRTKVGDRVVLSFGIACGDCEYCHKQQYSACNRTNDSNLTKKTFGHTHEAIFGYGDMLGGVPGSQAEYVRVPFADVNLFQVPKEIPDDIALYMSDILPTSLHATEMGEVGPGDAVAIWGLGPIGLMTARWCQIKGARRVIGIDLVPERLKLAREQLKIDVIDRQAVKGSIPEAILALEPEGVDCAVEAAGFRFATTLAQRLERAVGLETATSDILNECLYAVKKFGRVSVIGDYVGYTNHFAIGHVMFKHVTLRSGQCPCQKYFDEVLRHLKAGDIDPRICVTHRLTIEDIPDAYEKLFEKESGMVKVFISMDRQAA